MTIAVRFLQWDITVLRTSKSPSRLSTPKARSQIVNALSLNAWNTFPDRPEIIVWIAWLTPLPLHITELSKLYLPPSKRCTLLLFYIIFCFKVEIEEEAIAYPIVREGVPGKAIQMTISLTHSLDTTYILKYSYFYFVFIFIRKVCILDTSLYLKYVAKIK